MSVAHKIPAWIAPVTFVALLLGFLLVSAFSSQQRESADRLSSRYGIRASSGQMISVIDEKEEEIAKLRDENAKLLDAQNDRTKRFQLMDESLKEAKLVAGLSEVEGPGVEITLRDSDDAPEGELFDPAAYNIHDDDILKVLNECWLSGAEAVAVHNQRVIAGTSIRCEGPVIYVSRVPVSSPVVIRAIGDADTLYGALKMRGRWLDIIASVDPTMVEIKKVKSMTLPAYTGSTKKQFSKPVVPKE